MANWARPLILRYVGAAASVALMTVVRFGLTPAARRPPAVHRLHGRRDPHPRYGGVGPSVVTIALSCLAGTYFFLPPYRQFEVEHPGDLIATSFFALVSAAVVASIESSRAAERRLAGEAAERQRAGQADARAAGAAGGDAGQRGRRRDRH